MRDVHKQIATVRAGAHILVVEERDFLEKRLPIVVAVQTRVHRFEVGANKPVCIALLGRRIIFRRHRLVVAGCVGSPAHVSTTRRWQLAAAAQLERHLRAHIKDQRWRAVVRCCNKAARAPVDARRGDLREERPAARLLLNAEIGLGCERVERHCMLESAHIKDAQLLCADLGSRQAPPPPTHK